MFVPQEHIPPVWRPVARFRYWRRRRARAKAVGAFSSYRMPVIRADYPGGPVPIQVQPMVQPTATTTHWNVVYRRVRWWRKLWRWAKGTRATGC